MRVLFAGTPEVALPVLHSLMDNPAHEIVGVLTRADARQGRGRTLHPSPVAAVAREAGLEVLTPATLKDDEVRQWVRDRHADVAVVVAYGKLVPTDLLQIPQHGWLNLHFSLLPAWRGAAPVQRAIMAGDTVTGACVFQLESGLDTGPVFGRLEEPIQPTDTAGDLLDRLAGAGVGLVNRCLEELEAGTAEAHPQAQEGISLAPQLSTEDARIDWSQPASTIDCLIRGVTPAPGAHTLFDGARFRLGPAAPVAEVTDLVPGQIRALKHEVLVGTGSCALRLGTVAPAGKKWMEADAWARGAHPDGKILGQAAGEEA